MVELCANVAVDYSALVRCEQPGFGHAVYRRIHVVRDDGKLMVLAHVGTPHATIEALVLNNLVDAVAYLRAHGEWEKMSGLWREIVVEIVRRRGE